MSRDSNDLFRVQFWFQVPTAQLKHESIRKRELKFQGACEFQNSSVAIGSLIIFLGCNYKRESSNQARRPINLEQIIRRNRRK